GEAEGLTRGLRRGTTARGRLLRPSCGSRAAVHGCRRHPAERRLLRRTRDVDRGARADVALDRQAGLPVAGGRGPRGSLLLRPRRRAAWHGRLRVVIEAELPFVRAPTLDHVAIAVPDAAEAGRLF